MSVKNKFFRGKREEKIFSFKMWKYYPIIAFNVADGLIAADVFASSGK